MRGHEVDGDLLRCSGRAGQAEDAVGDAQRSIRDVAHRQGAPADYAAVGAQCGGVASPAMSVRSARMSLVALATSTDFESSLSKGA
jgi:hypothetical protein